MNNTSNNETSPDFDFKSPSTAPVLRRFMGDFGKRLFERSEFPIAAHETAQHRGKREGCHLLWLLSFGQAKESNSPVARERQFRLTSISKNTLIYILYS